MFVVAGITEVVKYVLNQVIVIDGQRKDFEMPSRLIDSNAGGVKEGRVHTVVVV